MANKTMKIEDPVPEIGNSNLLEPNYAPHYQTWKDNPSPKTMTNLIKAVNPVIDSALRSYVGKVSSPTIKSRAKLIAADAIKSYDPTKGKLQTHLMTNLQGLHRFKQQESQIIGVPERVALDSYRLYQSENELKDQLGRDPSTIELSDHARMSPKRITYVRQFQPGMAEGSTKSIGDEGELNVSGPAVKDEGVEQSWKEFIYHDLNPTDQLIMEHSLGLHGRKPLSKLQIAKKLKISPSAISQRSEKIQNMLDKREEVGGQFFGG